MKITEVKAGVVFLQKTKKYGNTAFVKIADKKAMWKCQDCGIAVWNVNNFVCDVHFCSNRDFDLVLTNWGAQKKDL